DTRPAMVLDGRPESSSPTLATMLHHALRGLRPLAGAAVLAAAALAQSPLTIGNLFVVRVGDGTAALSSASTATFVDEYTPGGVRFVASLGSTTSVPLHQGQLSNTRVVTLYNGQLYTSAASGQFQGVSTVGTGLPTSGVNSVLLLNGFPIAAGPSAYDHFFAD